MSDTAKIAISLAIPPTVAGVAFLSPTWALLGIAALLFWFAISALIFMIWFSGAA